MNFHYLFKEMGLFLVVLIFFVIPSMLNSSSPAEAFSQWNFPLFVIISCAASVLAVFIKDKKLLIQERYSSLLKVFLDSGVFFLTFGVLCVSAALFQLAASFLGSTNSTEISIPHGISEIIFCILTFIFASVMEECIFRLYLPKAMFDIFKLQNKNQALQFTVSELIPCILFALCHRYLGCFAVMNAFVCHFALRFCYVKTKCVFWGIGAHFLYNIMNLVVLCYLS